jgi:hypothetical protein
MPMIKDKLIDEINQIPDEKLLEVYNFIHYFRLNSGKTKSKDKKNILSWSSSWKEMNTEVFNDFMSDITKRRENAFSGRRK